MIATAPAKSSSKTKRTRANHPAKLYQVDGIEFTADQLQAVTSVAALVRATPAEFIMQSALVNTQAWSSFEEGAGAILESIDRYVTRRETPIGILTINT